MNIAQRLLIFFALSAFSFVPQALAANGKSNVACPVESPYDGETFEEKFGSDVLDKMRCNKRRSNVRLVMQVNQYEQGGKPYGFRNLNNIIKDFEKTHGIDNWKIAVVVHSGGRPLVLDDSGINNHIEAVKNFVANPNIDVYYCLNTAAAWGDMTDDIIEGVKFVPAGLSSIMDFQYQGYKYIQP